MDDELKKLVEAEREKRQKLASDELAALLERYKCRVECVETRVNGTIMNIHVRLIAE